MSEHKVIMVLIACVCMVIVTCTVAGGQCRSAAIKAGMNGEQVRNACNI